MAQMTCADAIAESLIGHGIDTVFGVPGVQIYALYDAFQRANGRLKVITTRHEQAAAYMAFGYTRSTGRPSAYAVVPGPGVLNTTAALCTAAGCNQPVLCLTGEVPSGFIGLGRGHLHELRDQLGTLRSLAKWGERVDAASMAGPVVAEAFRQMQSGRQGPAVIAVPWDVLSEAGDISPSGPGSLYPAKPPDAQAVARVAELIAKARRPLIVVGGGAIDAAPEVGALAERLKAPVMAFRSGRGIVAEDGPLAVSVVAGHELWEETDLLIGIGSRLEVPYLRWSFRPEGLKVVRVDVDPREMVRLPADAGLTADAKAGLTALLAALEGRSLVADDRRDAIAEAKAQAEQSLAGIHPHAAYLKAIRSALPRDGIFVEELCQAGYTSYFGFPVYAPRTYISCGYQGTLGFGYMTALGAKVANPDRAVVSITGDGGFLFGMQELATAAHYGIGVVVIVFDNSAYGNVRRDQKMFFDARMLGSDLTNPDFVALGRAFGIASYLVERPTELEDILREALALNRPALIRIPVDPDEEVSPWPLLLPSKPKRQ